MLVAIEGITGSGKTTVSKEVHTQLIENGFKSVLTREPGGCPLGERIRTKLRTEKLTKAEQRSLFVTMRDLHEKSIRRLLERRVLVISDRFRGAFVAYHGYRMGESLKQIEDDLRIKTPYVEPNLTILLNINPIEGICRKFHGDDVSAFDTDLQGIYREYLGYLELAENNSWRVIDASQDLNGVIETVYTLVSNLARSA